MKLSRYIKVCSVLLVCFWLTACSLLEVKIESQSTPLSKKELSMRLMTREYTQSFFSLVETNADLLAMQYPIDDGLHQSYILLWKIHAEEGMQSAAYQVSPYASLIDSWVFTHQVLNYFESEHGKVLFENQTYQIVASQTALSEIQQLAKSLLVDSEYQSSVQFVNEFALKHAFSDIAFIRAPAYRAWLAHLNLNEAELDSTVGTMPEAMADVSQRLSLVSEQTPKILSWKVELVARNSAIDAASINRAVQSIETSSDAFQTFLDENPQYIESLTKQMRVQLEPVIVELGQVAQNSLHKIDDQIETLDSMIARERIALIALIESERNELALLVDEQRLKVTDDLDTMANHVVSNAIGQLESMLQQILVYLILLVCVVLFLPVVLFYLGYRLGRKKNSST